MSFLYDRTSRLMHRANTAKDEHFSPTKLHSRERAVKSAHVVTCPEYTNYCRQMVRRKVLDSELCMKLDLFSVNREFHELKALCTVAKSPISLTEIPTHQRPIIIVSAFGVK